MRGSVGDRAENKAIAPLGNFSFGPYLLFITLHSSLPLNGFSAITKPISAKVGQYSPGFAKNPFKGSDEWKSDKQEVWPKGEFPRVLSLCSRPGRPHSPASVIDLVV